MENSDILDALHAILKCMLEFNRDLKKLFLSLVALALCILILYFQQINLRILVTEGIDRAVAAQTRQAVDASPDGEKKRNPLAERQAEIDE